MNIPLHMQECNRASEQNGTLTTLEKNDLLNKHPGKQKI